MNEEIHRNVRFNVIVNLLDGGFFGFAIGIASFSTVIPLFISTLTPSAILIGLAPAIHSVGWQLPQLLTVGKVSRLRRYKPMVISTTIHERLPFLGMALSAALVPVIGTQWALTLAFLFLIWQGLGGGFTATAWQSMLAKIIPQESLGTFYGAQSAAANLMAAGGAVIAGAILENWPSPADFVTVFLLACALMTVSWVILAQTREPASEPTSNAASQPAWQAILAILKRDINFRWFLVARMLSQSAVMGIAFYTVYLVRYHGVSEGEVGIMTAVLLGAQFIAGPLLGWVGDRWGYRLAMEIGMVGAIASALLAWWAPGPIWFYPVFLLVTLGNAAVWTVSLVMIVEFGTPEERPAYIGLANTLVAPATILAPIFGGWLADTAGYQATFFAAAIGGLLTLIVLHFALKDPRPRSAVMASIPAA